MFTMIRVKRPAFLQRLLKLPRQIVERTISRTIRRSADRYLTQQGWRLAPVGYGREWQGYYRTRYGSFKGRVVASSTPPGFYVYKPPAKLSSHSHSACFTSQGNGWHSVHFRRVPKDIDSGVIAIERILYESMRLK